MVHVAVVGQTSTVEERRVAAVVVCLVALEIEHAVRLLFDALRAILLAQAAGGLLRDDGLLDWLRLAGTHQDQLLLMLRSGLFTRTWASSGRHVFAHSADRSHRRPIDLRAFQRRVLGRLRVLEPGDRARFARLKLLLLLLSRHSYAIVGVGCSLLHESRRRRRRLQDLAHR